MAQPSARQFSISITPRRHAVLGLVSAGVILLGTAIAGVAYQGRAGEAYSPLNHMISELGEIGVSRLAWAFNVSILLGGTGLGIFLMLLAGRLGGRHRTALITVGAVAGVAGALVGVFPMDYHSTHRIVAGVFFLTAWLITVVVSLWVISAPRPDLPRWLLIPGAIAVAVSVAFIAVFSTYRPADPDAPILNRPGGFWAVPSLEWATLLSLLAWFVCVSIALLREPPE
jgi:hypothetical membrane protein